MSYASHAAQYQEVAVRSASPGQLVVMVYDHLLLNLRRTRLSVEQGNADLCLASLDRARNAIGELVATLDHEQGGELAGQLSGLYAFILAELSTIGPRPDVARLDRLITMSAELRDAFAAIASASADGAPAAAREVA